MTTDHAMAAHHVSQITLPGQAATAEGPLDMTMMYVMHHAFRRDLVALAAAAAVTPVGAVPTWQAMERRWALFAFALHHHHRGEDEGYWPLMTQRAAEADRETLEAMEAEHDAIGPLLSRCARGFRAMAGHGSLPERRHLHESLVRALDHLDAHLAHEEVDAIPLLQAHLTPEEDEQIEREHFRAGIPLGMVLRLVPWAMHGLPEREREVVLTRVGTAYRWLCLATRGWFARADWIALRYAG